MENEFQISNIDEIYKGDFDDLVALQGLEVFDKSQVDQFMDQFGNILEKSETDEISQDDKDKMELIKSEVNSLKRWEVIDNNFKKSICFTRPIQVDIEKGVYKDTALNRKLGRVGKDWVSINNNIR